MAVELIKDANGHLAAVFRFGGGLNTTTNPSDINPREAVSGRNFLLRLDGGSLKKRPPFKHVATVPNAREIMGYAELIDQAGTVSALIQAGPIMYQWDGVSTFTSVGATPATSRLRGNRKSTSLLDGKVVITDLARQEVVKTWDGTTYADHTHNLGAPLFAKYGAMHGERLFLGNVQSGTATPHVLLASEVSDITVLTVTDRPSSSLNEEDPFFLPMGDLRPINGIINAFGLLAISSEGGEINKLTGASAKDFALDALFDDSAAAGDEAIAYVGNDVFIGRHGKIESLGAIEAFGDVATDDVSRWIGNIIKDIRRWTINYDSRLGRVYLWPDLGGNGEVYVFEKAMFDPLKRQGASFNAGSLSPWMIYTTAFGDGRFDKTASFFLRNPSDGIDRMYYGDAVGRIFQFDGEGTEDPSGTDIETTFTTAPIQLPLDRDSYDFQGALYFKRGEAATVTVNFLFQGRRVMKVARTLSVVGGSAAYFGGSFFFGGDNYFGMQFEGYLERQYLTGSGAGDDVQLEFVLSGANAVEIDRLDLRFVPKAA